MGGVGGAERQPPTVRGDLPQAQAGRVDAGPTGHATDRRVTARGGQGDSGGRAREMGAPHIRVGPTTGT